MNEKISLNINIPTVNKIHNYIVPGSMSISKIIYLVEMTLSDEYGISKDSNDLMLVDTADNKILNKSCNLKQMGILSGATLILL